MQRPITLLTICVVLIFCSCKTNNEHLIIENNLFSKTFSYELTKAGSILVEVKLKESGETVAKSDETPYFEFVIDNNIVSSNEELWIFKNGSTRKMGNGGTEHAMVFEGVKIPVAGLQVKLLQQTFPGSTLMREKLELYTEGKSFQLNKLDGKLHFKFPSYSIQNKVRNPFESTEVRIASFEKKPITFGNKMKGNHMYYPDIIQSEVTEEAASAKGPVSIVTNGEISWFTAYEHASQDDLTGLFRKTNTEGEGNMVNDAMQGIKGVFNFPVKEEDFKFLGISSQLNGENINISVEVLRGGYLDGEVINDDHPYSTVWTATGFYDGDDLEDGKAMLRNYLFNQICEKPASRVPEFYYNTWGMQRNDKTKPLRGILTYDRIFEEIEYAAELGVDIFVLDDGWENAMGDWYPNKERLPQGLAPIKERLDKHGMKMGLWYSPMGIDSTLQRYKDYYHWVVKDSEGNPVLAQWNHPAFDFVSDFFDLFVQDCKNMIDEGCRFMKWDAINTFYSSLPNLHHGSDAYPEEEIRARYEYLLPIYVVRAMEILTDYEPELIIEMDLTEARRVMTGLAPLSQGKLFWMNNGASWYNDYTTFRTQSMRTIANEFAGIIPLELFTYANYPHNITGNMKYNVHNSLLAGHGFWGNLQLMKPEERQWIGEQVKQSKKVLPYLVDVNPKVTGVVGDSPEIYEIVNKEEAAGQVITFTAKPTKRELNVELDTEKLLVALNNQYSIINNQLKLPLNLEEKESSVAVIIIPNEGNGVSIVSSTSAITDANVHDKLAYTVSDVGTQTILTDKKLGEPTAGSLKKIDSEIKEKDSVYELEVKTKEPDCEVIIEFGR